MQGWIKLHRQLSEWEWYTDSQAVHLFVHFILNANHQDGKWQGNIVKRGQYISGIYELSKQTGISEQSIRTNIKRLKSTGELTSQSTNRFTIYTIVNYDKFQGSEFDETSQSTSQLTNNQQATNKQLTTNKNDKNKKNDKKLDIPDFVLPEFRENFARMKLHRIEKKKPMTSGAETLLHNTMIKCKAAGCDITELVDYSIMKGYETIYLPDKDKPINKPAQQSVGKKHLTNIMDTL